MSTLAELQWLKRTRGDQFAVALELFNRRRKLL